MTLSERKAGKNAMVIVGESKTGENSAAKSLSILLLIGKIFGVGK